MAAFDSGSQVERPEATYTTNTPFSGSNHPFSPPDNTNNNNNKNENKNHNNNDNTNNNNNNNKNENTNNNNNNNKNENTNNNSSNSSSSSDARASASAGASATGGNANAEGGAVDRSGNSSISTTNVDNSRTTFERSAPPVILPNFTNANCSNNLAAGGTSPVLGFSFGKSGYDKGCEARQNLIIENQQKAWQQNFDFQKQVYEDNKVAREFQITAQRDVAIAQTDVQQTEAELRQRAELLKLACDASVSHGTVAHTGYGQLSELARTAKQNPAARQLLASEGALTVGEAAASLKLGSVCAEGIAQGLGIGSLPPQTVPTITIDDLNGSASKKKK